jgi:hypothetical protein
MSAISKIKAAMKLAQELKTAPVEVNQSRRTMGLSLPKPESVTDIANYHANNAPAVVPQPNLVPPLQTIINMPVSRRKVLQTPVQAAVSHVGRGLIGDMAIKPIIPVESLTADAAHEHASNYLSKLLDRSLKRSEEGIHEEDIIEALTGQISLKSLAKKAGVSEAELAKHMTDDELKTAFDYAANEHNNIVEGNNDMFFPADEHVENAFNNFKGVPQVSDIHSLNAEAYENAKKEAYDAMLNPFNGKNAAESIANKTFQKHSGQGASEAFEEQQDWMMDHINDLVNERFK